MTNPKSTLFLILILWALTAAGCVTPQSKAQSADIEFRLKTGMADGKMVFVGAGGTIDGTVNPDLIVHTGDTVRIVIANDDGIPHDIAVPDFTVQTPLLTAKGQTGEVIFQAAKAGEFEYYCTVSGHRQIGMEGKVIVTALREQ